MSEFARQWFVLAGVLYHLQLDPDAPQLIREVPGQRPAVVATFGPAWSPSAVLEAAAADRAGLGV